MIQRMMILLAVLGIASSAFGKEYIVKYKSDKLKPQLKRFSNLKVLDSHSPARLLKVSVNGQQEKNTVAQLLADSNVEYVVENFKLYALAAPLTEKQLQQQWANEKVNLAKAWQVAGNKGSKNIKVAVIDTGVDYRHESLAANAIPGYDFRDNDNDPMDLTGQQNPGHGTHCSGSIAGTGTANNGIEGASPVLSLMPIRFLGADGSGDLMGGVKSIDYAIEKGAHIISASWGAAVARSQAGPLIEAVKRADDAGIIFVAAAANDGKNNDTRDIFPANAGFPNMISVAASDSADAKPSWSNFGKRTVHIASPGHQIISTLPGNKYGQLSGTSMATPLVAGIVALLKAQDPSLTGAQVRALLQTTGSKVSIETACNCRVDAGEAMDHLKASKAYMVPVAYSLAAGESVKIEVKNASGPFTYDMSNANVGSVNAEGVFTASGEGSTQITVNGPNGLKLQSLDYHVGAASSGEQPPGGGGECPLGDPAICQIACQFMPELPWCSK